MNTTEMISEIMKALDIEKIMKLVEEESGATTEVSKSSSSETIPDHWEKSPDGSLPAKYCSCRFADLLNEIKYYPNGDAPKEHNVLWSYDDKSPKWFCSDKKVAIVRPEDNAIIIVADNAVDRYKKSVATKWAMKRDWIPDYRYTTEDNENEVWLAVQEAFVEGADRSTINKRCFDRLDYIHRARPDTHKTLPKEENCNDAERFMYAKLFTGDIESLSRLENENGEELPLPTEDALLDFSKSEIEQFKNIATLFARVKEKHNAASIETWLSAQCHALNMPTQDAIQLIYGDKAVGKKKSHRCNVAYSRQHNQVTTWILEELAEMQKEGLADGLTKWIEVLTRSKEIEWDKKVYDLIQRYNLMGIEEKSPRDEGITKLIIVNPFRARQLLESAIFNAEDEYGADFFGELMDLPNLDDEEEVGDCVFETVNA